MDSVRNILPGVLRKRGLHVQAEASLVTHRAQEWLWKSLPTFRDAVTVTKLSHAVLLVVCRHGIAAQECRQVLSGLHAYLKKECPHAVVEDIRIERAGR